jgi:subtilase family serine protease
MRLVTKTLTFLVLLGLVSAAPSKSVKSTGSWTRTTRAQPNHPVTVGLLVKEKNLDKLNQLFKERTDPRHPDYAKWMTPQEIGELVQNKVAQKQVTSFLNAHNVSLSHKSKHGQYIKATMPVWKAEEMFQTEFYEYASHEHDFNIVKTESHTIPLDIDFHIDHVDHISHFPKKQGRMISYASPSNGLHLPTNQYTTPDLIYKTYNVPSTPLPADSKSF